MVSQIGQSSQTNNVQQPNANVKDRAELEKQIRQDLEDRMLTVKTRLSGANEHIKSTKEEISKSGFFSWASGDKKVLQEQLVKEIAFRDKVKLENEKLNSIKKEVDKLLAKGDLAGAKLILDKGLEAYKNKIFSASNDTNSSYNQGREERKNVDSFLANAETVCEVSKEVAKGTAVAAATIGTGGLAGVAIGVAVGTGTGAVVNYGNAAQESYLFESKDASQAFSEANSKTLVDAKDSVVGALGAGAGGAIAGKVVGKAVSAGAKIGSGVIAGGTSAAVTTGINTSENLVSAHIEFNQIYGEQTKNMKPEEVAGLKQEFFKSKGLTGEQILKSAIISVATGMASGGTGAGSNATRSLTNSATNKVGILAAEVLVTGAVAAGSEYVLTGETNIAKTFASTIQGAVIGELTANKNSTKPNGKSQSEQNPPSIPKPSTTSSVVSQPQPVQEQVSQQQQGRPPVSQAQRDLQAAQMEAQQARQNALPKGTNPSQPQIQQQQQAGQQKGFTNDLPSPPPPHRSSEHPGYTSTLKSPPPPASVKTVVPDAPDLSSQPKKDTDIPPIPAPPPPKVQTTPTDKTKSDQPESFTKNTRIPIGIKPEHEVPTEDGLGVYVSERTLYHGSNVNDIKEFNGAKETTVGEGVYLTSSKDSGSGYAKKRALNNGGDPILYTVKIKNAKLLDLRNRKNVQSLLKDYVEKNKDKVNQILTDPRKWNLNHIFRQVGGIEGIGPGDFQNAFRLFGTDLQNHITSQGYDGLITFEGGEGGFIGDHDSYVIFTPKNVEITRTENVKK